MRTHFRTFVDFSRFSSKVFSKSMFLHCIFHDKSSHFNHGSSMIVHALNVLLSGASPKHSPHPAGCFPGLLVSYFWLRNQALTWGSRGVYSQTIYIYNLWPLSSPLCAGQRCKVATLVNSEKGQPLLAVIIGSDDYSKSPLSKVTLADILWGPERLFRPLLPGRQNWFTKTKSTTILWRAMLLGRQHWYSQR